MRSVMAYSSPDQRIGAPDGSRLAPAAAGDVLAKQLDALVVRGVGRHEGRRPRAALRLHLFPQRHGLTRVVAGGLHEIDAEPVGLQLVLARIGQQEAELR